ncbi:MAG: hypothetical protein QF600_08030 [Verrucomicrobiota bacterium]|jgi:PBP1b-binding outer membrane lipoprotein LpoB|nr:hypothetical protein [Verrucomicrobiota bacterium]
MKHLLLTTIVVVLFAGCATQVKQFSPPAESKLNKPITEAPAQSLNPLSEADKAMINAALTGKIEAAKQAIVDDANANVKSSGRWTPVHFAAWGCTRKFSSF